MNETTKSILMVVVVVAVTAAVGYFAGFAGLFAHSMMEIFYYAGLFGGVQVLAMLVSAWWKGGRPVPTVGLTNTNPNPQQPVAQTGTPNYQA